MLLAPLLIWLGYREVQSHLAPPPVLDFAPPPPLYPAKPAKPADSDLIAVAFIGLALFFMSKG
ncbi:MAG: hypothetical protein ACK4KX_03235 [Parvibaculum sp.]|uniref:hypothetical protein n=1 Tax=Parvibaculum sp. TaxID=2024848 RepID=UPI00391C4BFB